MLRLSFLFLLVGETIQILDKSRDFNKRDDVNPILENK